VSAALDVLEWGSERVRTGTWRGRSGIAYLAPVPGSPAPSPSFLDRCLRSLAERGYGEVITGALSPPEQRGFLAAGFEVREHLVLLAHDLLDVPDVPNVDGVRLRRARKSDRPVVLDVDHAAFREFWRLDDSGLEEAINATPAARFRVAVRRGGDGGGTVVGYAVTGRAGRHGYLQRLAVDPATQRHGIARALVLDGLQWLVRRDAARVLVNTQPDNDRALALYHSLGFRQQAGGLDVLCRRLPTA
jgi:ribosomal protein S18 acetylase RimI-like enzyme